jgi:hypothetical protein
MEKSSWVVSHRAGPFLQHFWPSLSLQTGCAIFLPWVATKRAPVSHEPRTSASLRRGRKPLRTRPDTVPITVPNPSHSSPPASRCSPVQFWSIGHPRAVPQRCPAKSSLLRYLAPSRTEASPHAAAHVCRCRARIVTMPSENLRSARGRRLTDKPWTRQGAHAPPRLSLASCCVTSHR